MRPWRESHSNGNVVDRTTKTSKKMLKSTWELLIAEVFENFLLLYLMTLSKTRDTVYVKILI